MQIGDDMQLSKMSHYVAGIDIPSAPTAAVAEATVDEVAFAAFYRTLGVHYLPTMCDGDFGLDVMCLILGVERSLHERTPLREELSDYLIDRQDESWMLDILVTSCELEPEEVNLSRSDEMLAGCGPIPLEEGKIAEIALEDPDELEHVSEETMDAMRWASNIDDDSGVLALVRALPIPIVQEQVRLYNERETAVATRSLPKHKIVIGSCPSMKCKHAVAKRFDRIQPEPDIYTHSRIK